MVKIKHGTRLLCSIDHRVCIHSLPLQLYRKLTTQRNWKYNSMILLYQCLELYLYRLGTLLMVLVVSRIWQVDPTLNMAQKVATFYLSLVPQIVHNIVSTSPAIFHFSFVAQSFSSLFSHWRIIMPSIRLWLNFLAYMNLEKEQKSQSRGLILAHQSWLCSNPFRLYSINFLDIIMERKNNQ